jgi:hypothetical protein
MAPRPRRAIHIPAAGFRHQPGDGFLEQNRHMDHGSPPAIRRTKRGPAASAKAWKEIRSAGGPVPRSRHRRLRTTDNAAGGRVGERRTNAIPLCRWKWIGSSRAGGPPRRGPPCRLGHRRHARRRATRVVATTRAVVRDFECTDTIVRGSATAAAASPATPSRPAGASMRGTPARGLPRFVEQFRLAAEGTIGSASPRTRGGSRSHQFSSSRSCWARRPDAQEERAEEVQNPMYCAASANFD